MSDGLTPPPHPTQEPLTQPPVERAGRRPTWLVVAVQALVVVALFAAAGSLCGILWYHLWTSPHGVVSDHQWYTDETGLREDFAGTGLYVAIAVLVGLALGAVTAWSFDRSELATLVAVVVGSVLAGWLMLRVGYHLSPPDPDTLARTAGDGTKLDGALRVHRLSPRLVFPMGALVGLCLVYFLTGRRPARAATRSADQSFPA